MAAEAGLDGGRCDLLSGEPMVASSAFFFFTHLHGRRGSNRLKLRFDDPGVGIHSRQAARGGPGEDTVHPAHPPARRGHFELPSVSALAKPRGTARAGGA